MFKKSTPQNQPLDSVKAKFKEDLKFKYEQSRGAEIGTIFSNICIETNRGNEDLFEENVILISICALGNK